MRPPFLFLSLLMATFVFSNRAIQRRLDCLEDVLSPKQLDDLIARLNRVNEQRLQAMWEVVFLAALSQNAPFQHETALANGSRPDFQFLLPCGGDVAHVVGDVTTVSDSGLDRINPVEWFHEQLFRMAEKKGLNPNGINTHIAGGVTKKWPKQRVELRLSRGQPLQDILKTEVEPFLKAIAQSEDAPRSLIHQSEVAHFSITYDSGQWASSGNHISYDVIHSLTENHIYRAIKEKADQLRGAPDDSLRLVVLCDNDCSAMRVSGAGSGFNAAQIAQEYLRRSNSVDLVLLITVKPHDPYGMKFRDVFLDLMLVTPPRFAWSSRLTESRHQAVFSYVKRLMEHLPQPVLDTRNACIRARSRQFDSCRGGYTMTERKLTLSARAVQELLAGCSTRDEFQGLFGWHDGEGVIETEDGPTLEPNPFRKHLQAGRLLTSLRLIAGGDSDDDFVEFTFGSQDAAASPFKRRS